MARESSQADGRLRELGFDPSAPPEQAIGVLKSLRERAASGDSAAGIENAMIARALGGIFTTEAAAMLVEMERGATGGLRREIRRALFRLSQHGVEIPSSGPRAILSSEHPRESGGGLSGLLSPPDGAGTRLAWLLKARSGGGLRRLWGLVSEREGLVSATLESVTRKELRSDRAEIERRAGIGLIEADWPLVDFILCEAYRRTSEAGRGRVGSFLALRTELVSGAPPLEIRHPVYDELAGALAAEPALELMREPEIGAYRLPAAAIKPYAEEVTNLQQSVIVLNRVQQEERINTVIERAISELLGGDAGYQLRRYLEDTAYVFAHTGKLQPAGWAAAAAARLRDVASAARSSFFQGFMRSQLGAVLANQKEQEREEPRLIMTPAEAMRARAVAQARRRGRAG